MSTELSLPQFHEALCELREGRLDARAFCERVRPLTVPAGLPGRFASVLAQLLDRLESSALFDGESCSFSARDLHDALQHWHDRAQAVLAAQA